jgi:hypothetical protein
MNPMRIRNSVKKLLQDNKIFKIYEPTRTSLNLRNKIIYIPSSSRYYIFDSLNLKYEYVFKPTEISYNLFETKSVQFIWKKKDSLNVGSRKVNKRQKEMHMSS